MRRLIVLVGLLLIACGSPTAGPSLATSASPERAITIPSPSPSPSPVPGLPVRLKIPALGIDSPIKTVGLMPDGSVGTPCDPTKPHSPCDTNASAWYDGSARPGAPGDAVLDGHVDWYRMPYGTGAVPAVFAHLDRLRVGGQVIVLDQAGTARRFLVDRVQRLPYPQQPAGTYDLSGAPSLTLITCSGVYVSASVGMSSRLYVHATLTTPAA